MRTARRFASILTLSTALLVPAPRAAATTIVVTKTIDTLDGTCDADCSLREALFLANTTTDADTVVVPAGVYHLTRSGPPEDAGMSGDLEVMNSVTIAGAGAGSTIIDAGEETGLGERVFEVAAFDTASTFEVTFSGLTITGGYMDTSFTGIGGGILVRSGVDVHLVDVGVIDNYVSFSGAGIQVETGSTLSLLRTTVADNSTTYNGFGAGIMAGGEAITIVDSVIAGNSATTSGGGLGAVGTTVTIRNTTISGNRADSQGGGLYADASTIADLRNVTITGNTADDDHAGGGDGGGIHVASSAATMRNTILADNRDGSPAGNVHPDCSGTLISAGHNLVGNPTGCTVSPATGDQIGASGSPIDPKLAGLADNGGPTETHALLAGSPAIDNGGADCEVTDQRGVARTGTCDVGAYEAAFCLGTLVNRVGTSGKDTLVGTSGADGFLAQAGNDVVKGLGGNDRACLGPGNDTGAGGGGKDRLIGEQGKDKLKGQGGNDRLKGGPGKDTCVGGGGKKDKAACETEKSVP